MSSLLANGRQFLFSLRVNPSNRDRCIATLAGLVSVVFFGAVGGSFVSATTTILSWGDGRPPLFAWLVPAGGWAGVGFGMRLNFWDKRVSTLLCCWILAMVLELQILYVLQVNPFSGALLLLVLSLGMFVGCSLCSIFWRNSSVILPDLGETLRGSLVPHCSLLFSLYSGGANGASVVIPDDWKDIDPISGVSAAASIGSLWGVARGGSSSAGLMLLWWLFVVLGHTMIVLLDVFHRVAIRILARLPDRFTRFRYFREDTEVELGRGAVLPALEGGGRVADGVFTNQLAA